MKDFSDRIAVVTGAGTGMGRELARALAAEGCHVALCDVLMDNLAETARSASAGAPSGTRVTIHECDVAEEAQMLAFRDAVAREHDSEAIHLLFNNAGIGASRPTHETEDEQLDRFLDVNLRSGFRIAREVLRMWLAREHRGTIVHLASIFGLFFQAKQPCQY